MKSIYKISFALLLSGLVSCSDFVDIESPTTVRQDQYFKTPADFTAAVTGLYSGLRGYYGGFFEVAELPSDNTQINGYNLGLAPIDQLNWMPSTAGIQNRWTSSYAIIARANALLARLPSAPLNEALKNQYTGESKFIRALIYFNLVQFFGEVPLVLKEVESEAEAYSFRREASQKVYEQIVQDLVDAGNLLPAAYEAAGKGRATKYAALGLLGKVYTTIRQFDKAVPVLEQVVSSNAHALLPNYADVFSTTNKNNKEIVFDIQYLGGSGFGEGSNFSILFAPFGSGSEITSGGQPGSSNAGTRDLFDAFEDGDKRKDVSIKLYPSSDSLYYTRKFLDKPIASNEGNNNWPVLRYSDVLLLLAEAKNETGNTTEALTLLNEVRQRAGLPGRSALTQEAFRQAVLQERRVELCFEGHRWFDLLRTGTMVSTMAAYKAKYLKWGGYLVDNYVVTENKVLFPVPFRELSLNPDLGQNPGY